MKSLWHIISCAVAATLVMGVQSCDNSEKPDPYHPTHTYILESSDNLISGDTRTISIEISEVLDNEHSIYDRYSFSVDSLQPMHYPDNHETYSPSGNMDVTIPWCHISDMESDGKQIVTVRFDSNNTKAIRGIRLSIATPGQYGEHYGWCDIIQLPKDKSYLEAMTIRYRSKVYKSTYHYIDNKPVFHDEEFAQVYDRLYSDPNIGMIILDSEIVDYYDYDDENFMKFTEALDRPVSPDTETGLRNDIPSTRAFKDGFQFMNSGDLGYFALFSDNEFSGNDLHTVVANFHNSYNLPNLKDYDMNDNISSLAVGYNGADPKVCAVLTLWDDADYNYGDNDRKKHRISIVASHGNPEVSRYNLKTIRCLNSTDNWNDRASCISCHFGYYDRSLLDY